MNAANDAQRNVTIVMDADAVAAAVTRLAREIVDAHDHFDRIAMLGILSRGRPLADRLTKEIEAITGERIPVGSLSTVLYRDDLRSGRKVPKFGAGETHFDFDVTGRIIILVDDVFATGRTIRAALDEVIDYGRPERIELACLVDRGARELPIRPDYLGQTIETDPHDHVTVLFDEVDGEDAVLLEQPEAEEDNASV